MKGELVRFETLYNICDQKVTDTPSEIYSRVNRSSYHMILHERFDITVCFYSQIIEEEVRTPRRHSDANNTDWTTLLATIKICIYIDRNVIGIDCFKLNYLKLCKMIYKERERKWEIVSTCNMYKKDTVTFCFPEFIIYCLWHTSIKAIGLFKIHRRECKSIFYIYFFISVCLLMTLWFCLSLFQ